MKTSSKIALALAATLGFSAVATAQPRYVYGPDRVYIVDDGRPGARYVPAPRYVYRHDHPGYRADNRHYQKKYQRNFQRYHRGDRLPVAYRGQGYVVNDYRAYHLSAPPRDHHWVKDGNDFALIAIATGVIASLVLAR